MKKILAGSVSFLSLSTLIMAGNVDSSKILEYGKCPVFIQTNRKLSFSAFLTVLVPDKIQSLIAAKKMCNDAGGYIMTTNIEGEIIFRIPVTSADSILQN